MADIKENQKSPLHHIQMLILNKMIFTPNIQFSELFNYVKAQINDSYDLTTDHFTYHINKLLESNLIYKNYQDNHTLYNLTERGKRFISIMDTKKAIHEQFGKRGVLIKAARLSKDKKFEYLVYKRQKQPFYGYYGFHTGKVRFGETIVDAAFREFKEETGLQIIDYELVGIYHQIGIKPNGEILRDIYLYEFFIYDFTGTLIKHNKDEGVLNTWLTKEALRNKPTYPDFWNNELKMNWTHYPKFYKRYVKLKRKNRWKNKPAKTTDTITFHEIKPYFVERIKIIESW